MTRSTPWRAMSLGSRARIAWRPGLPTTSPRNRNFTPAAYANLYVSSRCGNDSPRGVARALSGPGEPTAVVPRTPVLARGDPGPRRDRATLLPQPVHAQGPEPRHP